MRVAALIAGADAHDAVSVVRDTAAKLAKGEPTTGTPTLAELLSPHGETIVSCLRAWLDLGSTGSVEADEPDPLDLFDVSLAGTPVFPIETLPPMLRDFVVDNAERIGCDLGMTGMFGLAACGIAIDDRLMVQPKMHDPTYLEAPRLWVGGIGESGLKKSPIQTLVTSPVLRIEREWVQADAPLFRQYDIQRRLYERQLKQFLNSGGRDELPNEPDRPPRRRRVVDDITVEALGEILVDNPGGVGFITDELNAFLQSFDAYRSKGGGRDRALYLSAYNGGPKLIDRCKDGHRHVPNWSVSIVGGIQPSVIGRFARRLSDDGLLARFLLFYAGSNGGGVDRAPNYAAAQAYERTIAWLMHLQPLPVGDVFTFSSAGHAARNMIATIARNVSILPSSSAGLRAHLDKWEGHFARLALVWHLADVGGRDGELPRVIGEDCSAAVVKLMTNYLLPHAVKFYTEVIGDEHVTHAKWVAGLILAHRLTKISARDIGRAYNELRSEPTLIAQTMSILTLAGWTVPLDLNGRAPTRWRVNPRVHQLFARRAEEERVRRDAIRHEIAEAAKALGLGQDAAG